MSKLSQQGHVHVHPYSGPPRAASARSWPFEALRRLRCRPTVTARRSPYTRLAVVLGVLVVAFVLVGAAAAAPRHYHCGHSRPRAELRCARLARHQARSSERWIRNHGQTPGGHSRAYWQWRERIAERWIRSALARIHPIPHVRLWLCIHSLEANNWHDEDTGHNGHFGGLQMSWSWGYGIVGDPASYAKRQQMLAAERGYRANGYAQSWLLQQWNHPSCVRYA